jgi:hypothetical protein
MEVVQDDECGAAEDHASARPDIERAEMPVRVPI